ncbi:MAG: radical SAM protein [Clostridia bacterium]|nr:radical SAM protein [Clostridia bacterium]
MFYEGMVYRPPSEASSLILQVTVGCKHNACTFCTMYKDKRYRQRTPEEIEALIEEGFSHFPYAERIFLADGDALSLDTKIICDILKKLYAKFPHLQRVGIYGGPLNILEKSPKELQLLRQHGLHIVYLGIESGSAHILQQVNKGVTPEEMIAAGRSIVDAGLLLSCTVIAGLGGVERSEEHAVETARVLNAIDPQYVGVLTLMLEPGSPLLKQVRAGTFQLLNPWEILRELALLISELTLSDCTFRSNHASNYLSLKAHLPEEKESLLQSLHTVIVENRPELLKPESWRGL